MPRFAPVARSSQPSCKRRVQGPQCLIRASAQVFVVDFQVVLAQRLPRHAGRCDAMHPGLHLQEKTVADELGRIRKIDTAPEVGGAAAERNGEAILAISGRTASLAAGCSHAPAIVIGLRTGELEKSIPRQAHAPAVADHMDELSPGEYLLHDRHHEQRLWELPAPGAVGISVTEKFPCGLGRAPVAKGDEVPVLVPTRPVWKPPARHQRRDKPQEPAKRVEVVGALVHAHEDAGLTQQPGKQPRARSRPSNDDDRPSAANSGRMPRMRTDVQRSLRHSAATLPRQGFLAIEPTKYGSSNCPPAGVQTDVSHR